MEDRKLLIKKKTSLLKVKKKLELFKSFRTVDIIEADSDEIIKYREQLVEMHQYSYPKLSIRKLNKDKNIMIEWFLKEIPILRDNTVWIMPFCDMHIWWVKVRVTNCREAIEQLWHFTDVCIIEEESKMCYYIQVDEDNCGIAFKQLQ